MRAPLLERASCLLFVALTLFGCAGEEAGGAATDGDLADAVEAPSELQATVDQIRVLTESSGKWSHDFGEFEAGEEIPSHVFSFAWNGAEPLVPSALRPDCACLTAILVADDGKGGVVVHEMKQPIEPRSIFGVRVGMDLNGMKGVVKKTVLLTFDEPPGALRFILNARVR